MPTGKIGVTTENIFPVIKKFLYSDHEIFLRELVSNAIDATQKLKTLASFGEFKGELGTMDVRVKVDKAAARLCYVRRAAFRAGVKRKIIFFVAHLAGYKPLGVFADNRLFGGILLYLARLYLIILPIRSVKFFKRAVP